jgi:hypothetical protein
VTEERAFQRQRYLWQVEGYCTAVVERNGEYELLNPPAPLQFVGAAPAPRRMIDEPEIDYFVDDSGAEVRFEWDSERAA